MKKPRTIADAPWIAPTTAAVAVVIVVAVGLQRRVFTDPDGRTLLVLAAGVPWLIDAKTRRFPRAVWVVLVVGVATALFGFDPVDIDYAPFFLVYLVGTMATVLTTRASVAVAVLAAAPGLVLDVTGRVSGSVIWVFGITMAWFFGYGYRQQLMLLAELEEAQTTIAEAAAVRERQRLARELHDLIAHTLAVTMLHITGARLALGDGDADEALSGLEQAERTGREAMTEIRRTVGLLGPPSVDGDDGVDPPAPSVRDLPLLLDRFRAAGIEIDADLTGPLGGVPDGAGLAVYRVVQESLTNAAKHGAGARVRARVEVHVDDATGVVHVRVANAAAPRSSSLPSSDGLGVRGMHERVALLDGGIRVGLDGDEWVVDATIPTLASP